jgi:hypothetical protein
VCVNQIARGNRHSVLGNSHDGPLSVGDGSTTVAELPGVSNGVRQGGL